jgi:cyclic-di-GMP phosphodiesterase TipF (flagellum assembly factor)
MVFRCVRVVRQLLAKNREVGLFCNVALRRSMPPFSPLIEFLDANRAIAPSSCSIHKAMIRDARPIEERPGSDGGVASASRSTTSPTCASARRLATRGFAVKVPQSLLLDHQCGRRASIPPTSLTYWRARHRDDRREIETKPWSSTCSIDVRYGQGCLFSPPRRCGRRPSGAGETTMWSGPPPGDSRTKAARSSGHPARRRV